MQSRLSGCIWRTAKISRGNFQTYRWMADLRQWVPVKTNTQAPQITQNKLPGYGFEKLNGQNCTMCTQCVFLFYWAKSLCNFKAAENLLLNFLLRKIPCGRAVYSFKMKVKHCARPSFLYIYKENVIFWVFSKETQNVTNVFPYLITSVS